MTALGTFWAIHLLAFVMLVVFSSEPGSGLSNSLVGVVIVSAFAYLIQLGREAVKRKRRWIVWCGLAPIVPFWVALSFPIFYFVTRDDEQTN